VLQYILLGDAFPFLHYNCSVFFFSWQNSLAHCIEINFMFFYTEFTYEFSNEHIEFSKKAMPFSI
jgi:hypothetical protein